MTDTDLLNEVIDHYIEAERLRERGSERSHSRIMANGRLYELGWFLHRLTGLDSIEWGKLVDARRAS